MRRLIKTASAAALSFTLMAGANAQEPAEIGVLLPLSGPNASNGAKTLAGVNAALAEINELGGVLGGRELKLIIEDTESKPQPAIEAVRKLVDVNKVPLVLGDISSSVTIPTGKYTISKGMNQITIAATAQVQREIGDGLFTMLATNDVLGVKMAEFVVEDANPERVALVYMNDPFGVGMARATEGGLKDLGVEIAADLALEPAKTDYRAELQRLVRAKPDAIITVAFGDTARVILKQSYELGVLKRAEGKWYQSYVSAGTSKCIPEICEGIKGLDIAAEPGTRYDSIIRQISETTDDEVELDWFTSVGYDSVWVAALSLNFANSMDPQAIQKAIPKAMEIYRGVTKSDFSVDEDGIQVSQRYGRRIYTDGALTDYLPE
ncbi:MAG: ABC transporter substrate-binding protein [Kiloniellales bacterium]|nr:ABC transporter substrate-binding protein [Kiloniellales bacterium]